jgi:fibronectin-binding autotransporter adhesin
MNVSFLSVGFLLKSKQPHAHAMRSVAIASLFFVGASNQADAQVYQTWRSEATSGSWQGGQNWWKGSAGPIEFGQQEWNNNHYLEQTNLNSGSTLNTWRWLFQSGASSAHTFGGDTVRFFAYNNNDDPAIINQSQATHVINMNLEGDGDSFDPINIQIDNNQGGGLNFGGTFNNQGSVVRVIGSASSAATVTFNGAISGTAGFYKENSNLTVDMKGANAYSGDTTIQNGTLKLSGSGSLANSIIRLHSGGSLNVANDTSIKGVREEASGNAGTVTIDNGKTLTVLGTGNTIFQSSINGTGGNLKLSASTGSVLSLYNSQGYSGTTEVTGGKLTTSGAMSTAGVTTSDTGVFEVTSGSGLGSSAYIAVNGGQYIVGAADSIGALSGNSASGKLTLNAQLITTNNSDATFAGILEGSSGSLVKQGTGVLSLSGESTLTGGLFIDQGVLNLSGGSLAAGSIDVGGGTANNAINTASATLRVSAADLNVSRNIVVQNATGSGGVAAGDRGIDFANNANTTATLGGTVSLGKTTAVSVASSATGVMSGIVSGNGGITKSGTGTLTLSGASANTYTGLTTVSGGTLNLNKASGNAIVGSLTVGSNATLLLSSSDQVDSGATDVVTLSGGTIKRASGVSEVFGDLNVTAASFLDYSAGTAGSLTFTGLDYTPSGTLSLTLQNFTQGSTLVIQNTTDMSGLIGSAFKFGGTGGFGGSTFSNGTFTITAIPEPSTYAAAAGLLAMFLWPVRRRLVKDVKSVLGLRPTGRERIEAYRKA